MNVVALAPGSDAVSPATATCSPPILWGAVTLALCSLFLGYDIASRPIVLWDESRVVSNALEMSRSGFSLITTYNFQPDLWNTKPPLLIWLIAGCVRLFGPDEWAVRTPSLIAAVTTVGLVMAFSWRLSRNRFVTLCAPVLLTFSSGFFGAHAAQSADYEMLLCLFTTAYLLLLFETIHRRRPGAARVLLCALLVACACLTKGIAGVLPGVGVAIYVLFRNRWQRLFKTPWYGLGAVLAVGLVGAFYLLRERASTGYLTAVMATELGGRYLHGMKSHVHPPTYYLRTVFTLFACGPALLVLLAAPALRWSRTRSTAFITYGGFVSVAILVVYSLSQTKLFWYVVPVYPVLSIMLAIALQQLAKLPALSRVSFIESPRLILAVAATSLLTLGVWTKAMVLRPVEDLPQGRYGEVFAQLHKAGLRHVRAIDAGVVNDDDLVDYTPQLHAYAMVWRGRGMVIKFGDQGRLASIGPDEVVVTCDPDYVDAVGKLGASLATAPDCAAATLNTQARQTINKASE